MTAVETMLSIGGSVVQAGRVLAGPPRYVYCGFVGRGNLGDDAMFEVIKSRLDLGNPLVAVPGTPTYPLRMTPLLRRASSPGVVLGGGTLIGRYGWLDRVSTAIGGSLDREVVAIGTGVEDPDWSKTHALTDMDELKRWADYLRRRFDRVTVRGPRSAAILNRLGVDATIVGDPALLLSPLASKEVVREGEIVINLGASGSIWGSQQDLNSHVRDAASELIRRGFQIRLLVMWKRDRNLVEEFASTLPSSAVSLIVPRRPSDAMRELSGAHVVIGQRLHSVVMAAATHTPSLSLAYRPKCLDFQESIDRSRFTVRTDRVDTAELVDLTMEVADNRETEAQQLRTGVEKLRTALSAEIAGCRDSLSGSPSNS